MLLRVVLGVLASSWANELGHRSWKEIELSYVELSTTCQHATAISGLINVTSVVECEQKCDAQAAAAPGTGQPACIAVDTNGKNCYLKSVCGGNPGHCAQNAECGYRRAGVGPSPPPTPPAPPVPPAPPGMTLREAAKSSGVFIGAATNQGALNNTQDPMYKSLEEAQFDLTTAENACKFGPIHPQRDVYDWVGCDTVFNDAAAVNQSVRGHNLCWHTENPDWLINGHFNSTELIQILEDHITTVVSHYGTKAACWDVVNEALDNNGLKPSAPWYPAVPNYIDVAFRAARKAGGPNVKLFYNDYSAEAMNPKSDQVYNLVKGMQQRGVPIDGVGLQFHWSLEYHDSLDSVAANMARLHALGLEVHITELDVKCTSGSTPCTPNLLNAQAELYSAILKTCLDAPNCKSFETWGVSDNHSWLGAQDAALLFDTKYQPKPAFNALVNLLLNHSRF